MAKKITIQHLYTTSGTTAPTGLIEGEIAISHKSGSEAIFLKPRQESGQALEEIKFIPEVRIRKMFEEAGIGSNIDVTEHIATSGDTSKIGHVSLVSGNLQNKNEYVKGEAAASYHTHGQYLEENSLKSDMGFQMMPGLNGGPNSYGIKAGTGINVDSNGVSINDEYQTKITNGATAFSWGNHANADYAKNTDLTTLRNSVTAHTNSGDIHVTKSQKDAWDKAKSDIDAFMVAADSGNTALDTLKEIQDFLTSDDGTVQTLLDNLTTLTDTVSANTDSISDLNTDVNILKDNSAKYIKTLMGDDHIKVEKLTGTTTQAWALTHKPASTQASAITATNTTTDLSFGSAFTIVDKIGYDANGHVVSGSTQTLTLPNLPAADEDTAGIVKIKSGALGIEEELLPNLTGIAADICHYHTQYVKYIDLSDYKGTEPLVISCGTY